jgi:Transposase DDE domain
MAGEATDRGATGTATPVIDEIETFLREAITTLELEPARIPGQAGRARVLPSLYVWAGLLVCVLRGFSSQQALWRLLSLRGLWDFPRLTISDQAVADRLAADGPTPLQRLLGQISAVLAERLAPFLPQTLAAFATEVLAVDATTLDAVARHLPATEGAAARTDRRLPGKLAVVFDVRRQQWWRVCFRPDPHENDKLIVRDLVSGVARGSLLLFDLGYFAFKWFDELSDQGLWWVSRLRQKTSYELVHTFYRGAETLDALVWLGAYRADRSKHLVRLVQFRVGPTRYQYLTNVTDPHLLSLRHLAGLYQRRWDIEIAFNLIKTHLGLHLLWSRTDAVILAQVWAVLIIAQVLQALRLEIAGRAGVDPFDVSLPLLGQYLPQLAADGHDPIALLVERGRAAGIIRPSRRTTNRAPHIPAGQIRAPPPDLCRLRSPRYAGRT